MFSKDTIADPNTNPAFDPSSFKEAMNLFSQLWQRFSCLRGIHHGDNFCMYCGRQLASEPFFSYRVRSSDGQLDVVLKARNAHHAKRQLQSQYPPFRLTVQRVADD